MEITYNILIVDDADQSLKNAISILNGDDYSFLYANDANEAYGHAKEKPMDLVLVDVMDYDSKGFDVIKLFKDERLTQKIPILFVIEKNADDKLLSRGYELGAIDYIIKPFHPSELLSRISTHLSLFRLKAQQKSLLMSDTNGLLSELEATQKEIIYILTELMESTCDETGKHIKRVAEVAELLAYLHNDISDEEAHMIANAAPLHDIGKITIEREILNKPSSLSEQEFRYMKEHTTNAHYFLKRSNKKLIKAGDIIAHQHHEKWDGTGYPQGLQGGEIHIYGRIVALADVLDTLTHKRVYKDSWSFEDAAKYITDHKGSHFDPYLVELFENNLEKFRKIIED